MTAPGVLRCCRTLSPRSKDPPQPIVYPLVLCYRQLFKSLRPYLLFQRRMLPLFFGSSGFATSSVGTRGILFQRWTLSSTNSGETTSIIDLGSYGDGLACASTRVGTYFSDWNADCGVQLCGQGDSCVSRGELLHGAKFNGFQTANVCPRPPNNPGLNGFGKCNPTANEWTRHPYDCTEQLIDGGCMFCLGRANGKEARQCLDRNGVLCNDIFNSAAGHAYCTLEFECPASTATLSLVVFISSVALLLFR